ncbi:MAG: ATP/GTP-binding protein [Candidatus Bathyarchaeia archaeon]
MDMNIMILGPAGSGKSLLTGEFGKYLLGEGYSVNLMNLDPGCAYLPYKCDYDIRREFTIGGIMKREGLGPNGAMIRAMEKLSKIRIPIPRADFNLMDTPGQLEIFVFHESGPKVVGRVGNLVGIFLIDATIGIDDLPAAYLYSLAVRYRLGVEMITAVNKVDLLDEWEAGRIRDYLLNPASQRRKMKPRGLLSDIYLPLSELLQRVVPAQRIPMVSAKTGTGFDELLSILHEVKCACGDLT